MDNIVIALSFIVVMVIIYYVYAYRKFCLDLASKNKVRFYDEARRLLSDPSGLTEEQRKTVMAWSDVIDNKIYSIILFLALRSVYRSVSSGKRRPRNTESPEYSEAMAKLFVHWVWALIYSVPLVSLLGKDIALYLFNPASYQDEAPRMAEVNVDVFAREHMFTSHKVSCAA